MSEEKVILVTGGTGTVGSAIKYISETEEKRPNEKWIFVSSKDADLSDRKATEALFDKYKPTHVIHLVAKVGGLFENLKYNLEFYRTNTHIHDNVLNVSFKTGVTKVVSCLSTCIFPIKATLPFDETMLHGGVPHDSTFGNAFAMRMIDIQNKAYHLQHGCQFTSVAPTNVFGPHDNFNPESGHALAGLINRAYCAKRDNTEFVIWGSGSPRRQFIYSRDLARLMIWVLRVYPEIVQLFSQLVKKTKFVSKKLPRLYSRPWISRARSSLIPANQTDSSRKQLALQNSENTDRISISHHLIKKAANRCKISEAVKETCEWFKENYETARK